MSNKRWGCAADAVGGQLCVVEGYGKNSNILSSAEIYDPQTGRWGCAAATVGCQLCVVGRQDENDNIILSAEIYYPQTKKWTDIAPMRTKQSGCVAAAVRSQLCIQGGADENFNSLLSTEIYITAHVMSSNITTSQNILHVAETDEISQSLTSAKVPSTTIDSAITLEEILGLEGGTSGLVKRVKFLEETIIGNAQESSGGLMQRILKIEETMELI